MSNDGWPGSSSMMIMLVRRWKCTVVPKNSFTYYVGSEGEEEESVEEDEEAEAAVDPYLPHVKGHKTANKEQK